MSNIEIGIDLGTTNSEIAIYNGSSVEIVKNTYGSEFTPSVFGINKAKDEEVGKRPYERYFKDATPEEVKNNKPEIKRLMGTSDLIHFPRAGKDYNAEEISSKILNSLKQDAIRKKTDINTTAAVITVPAYFSTIQAEATKRAGLLAGFKYVVLLQEPIAAAISYGFGKSENENWLVYDLGGGTFDAALISSKNGNLKVLSHSGDNFLGGKDFDNLIIDKIILPALLEKYDLPNFNRANSAYSMAFAKLKYAAEQAKIQLSSMAETSIEVDIKVDNNEIYENINITQGLLEDILNPIILRTIDLCKQTINEAGIKTESVNKIILVGGPTQLPFIRKRLQEALGIFVDVSSDPLSAVACGACVFAMSQTIPEEFNATKHVDESTYQITLNYESLTCEEEELVTGLLPALRGSSKDYYIQIQSKDNTFNTGKIKLKDGKFIAHVSVRAGMLNSYWIYLCDENGNVLNITTDEFNITHGITISGVPIPRSIGVGVTQKDYVTGVYKQKYDVFFEKNSILPLEKTILYKTLKTVSKGDATNCLPITVYEGQNEVPEHNVFVCEVLLSGKELDFDLYEGSDIEITIKIDESRTLSMEAYIPAMDKSFNARADIYDESLDIDKMRKDIDDGAEKIREIEHLCSSSEKENIYLEVREIKTLLNNAQNDEDEKRKVAQKIKKLQSNIDDLQKSKKDDSLKQEFYDLLEQVSSTIKEIEDSIKQDEFSKKYEAIKNDGESAISKGNALLLSKTNEQLKKLSYEIIFASDVSWIYWFSELSKRPEMAENAAAASHISAGLEAIKTNNIGELKKCVVALWGFVPNKEKGEIETKIAGITH